MEFDGNGLAAAEKWPPADRGDDGRFEMPGASTGVVAGLAGHLA
jgi:hypothetical protein